MDQQPIHQQQSQPEAPAGPSLADQEAAKKAFLIQQLEDKMFEDQRTLAIEKYKIQKQQYKLK